MRKLLLKFWRDDCGAVGPEWACIMTVLVLGSVAALMAAQQTLVRDVTKAVEIVAAD
jgi:Flp pilus assembly pilin Flp